MNITEIRHICEDTCTNGSHVSLVSLFDNQLNLMPLEMCAADGHFLVLSDHPKPATDYHLKTGQRE